MPEDRRLWSESSSGYGGIMKVKVTVVEKIKGYENRIIHMITKVLQSNSRIYGKSVVLKSESLGGLIKNKTTGPYSQNFCLLRLR